MKKTRLEKAIKATNKLRLALLEYGISPDKVTITVEGADVGFNAMLNDVFSAYRWSRGESVLPVFRLCQIWFEGPKARPVAPEKAA